MINPPLLTFSTARSFLDTVDKSVVLWYNEEKRTGVFLHGEQLSTARYVRCDVGNSQAVHNRKQGNVGRQRKGYPSISEFLNGVFWILRTGAPWRDLPPEYGKWNTVQRRFCRWRDKGIWEKMLEAVIQEPDFEWLMIDASHIKVHPHASGAPGGNQDMARTKGGSTPKYIWPWMRMVCRSDFLSQQVPLLIVHRLVP